MFDFYRACACVPDIKVGDVVYNKEKIIEKIELAMEYKPSVISFPELSLTGYTCQDLFFQDKLIDESMKAISEIIDVSAEKESIIIIGSPVKIMRQLYNAAFVILNGTLLGISIKTFLPNYNEFYEKRHFSSAADLTCDSVYMSELGIETPFDYEVPCGNNIVYDFNKSFTLGVELCEDLWGPLPPSTVMALMGAEVIVNLSASNETIAKREYRQSLVKSTAAANMCEYIYVSAGSSESTQDLIFSGHSIICENGSILNESQDFIANDYVMISDMDLGKIRADRLKGKTFKDTVTYYANLLQDVVYVKVTDCAINSSDGSIYRISKHPFIPANKSKRLKRCNDIFDMQVGGLAKRLSVTNAKPVIGVSGGMDSTLALLVCAKALEKLGRPKEDLIAITMPAFGTTGRTFNNSLKLMESLGATSITIDIKAACTQHMKDLGHDESIKDITYENTQARERTQILMDYANKCGGLVVGTGDLSELALGWCTYNADQMSMYGVNASIPKTLVKWMISACIDNELFPESTECLKDIIDTPISPELLPPDKDGNIAQLTEDNVGPYELHDFFLYYMLRFGFTPSKIYYMACRVFDGIYTKETIKKWMTMFYRRFFTQQFKRSCMPDGVKVGSICLSPRGDLRMPSDSSSAIWLKEVEGL